jgi:hypothetical protein
MAKKGTLEITILGDEKPLAKSLKKASSSMGSWATGAVGIFAGLGVAAGAVFVSEFGDAMERNRLGDKLGAQLGLSESDAKTAGKIAGDLYANAYGDSLEQVHDAVGAVMSSLGDLDDEDVERLTAKALDLAAAFDVDVTESVGAVGVLMRTGLARDADHAFDLVVYSMQKVPAAMRGELIPIIEEYSQHFAVMGINGEDAFNLLIDAAGDGRFALDKTADAIKEMTLLTTDLSTASREAYDTIGLDAEEMANKIAIGGDTAREAFDQIVDGLIDIKDPATKANTAIALMGTPVEELGLSKIPAFLTRLDEMGGGMDDVANARVPSVIRALESMSGVMETSEGAADRLGTMLNDNVATDFEGFKRKAGAALDTFLSEHVLPDVSKIIDAFEEDGMGGAVQKAVELWEASQPAVERWFNGTFVPFWQGTATPWMSFLGGKMGEAIINGILESIVNLAPELAKQAAANIAGVMSFGMLYDTVKGIDMPKFDAPNLDLGLVAPTASRPARSGSRATGSSGGLAMMAHGGVVSKPTLAMIGEDARTTPEIVTPESLMRQIVREEGSGNGNTYVTVNAPNYVGSKAELMRVVKGELAKDTRRGGTLIANVARQ